MIPRLKAFPWATPYHSKMRNDAYIKALYNSRPITDIPF